LTANLILSVNFIILKANSVIHVNSEIKSTSLRLLPCLGRSNRLSGCTLFLLSLRFHLFSILDRRDHVQNTLTDDSESASGYITAVYRQPVVGEEHFATASLDPPGGNAETTEHGYIECVCCTYTKHFNFKTVSD